MLWINTVVWCGSSQLRARIKANGPAGSMARDRLWRQIQMFERELRAKTRFYGIIIHHKHAHGLLLKCTRGLV